MLQSIYIQNYALIDTLDISFTPGFSVITGETGAGKSIILGAIGLLLGQRADIKAIKKGANKCIVEARFNISAYQMEPFFTQRDLEYDPDECIIRRELYASGKSRAFINDTPASLAQMKELGEKLIDVHSQHQNLLLNSEGFQLNVLDILAQDDNELSAYKDIYTEYRNVCKQLADERAFTDLYDGQSGPSLPDHASPDGGTDRFPVRNPDGCGTRRGTGLKRRIPDGAVSGGCEIPGSLRCGTHHQGAGEYLRGQLQCALRKRPVCPLPVGRHGFRDRGKQGERDGGGAV